MTQKVETITLHALMKQIGKTHKVVRQGSNPTGIEMMTPQEMRQKHNKTKKRKAQRAGRKANR